MDFDQLPIGETWDLLSKLYLDLKTQHLQGIQRTMQHLHLEDFTHRELIWVVNFRFGAQKTETTYIP
jgi:hypothetical protein